MNKRIISFSLYGTEPAYQIGALENLALQKSVYPEWTCRFYVSSEIPDPVVHELRAGGAEVIVMHRTSGIDGMFWRFLPASELDLDALIVRDVDSRLGYRERAAVDEWLSSGRGFHIMRDHPDHRCLILGGMWGCRGGVLPQIACLISRWPHKERFGQDQKFLSVKIYPRVKSNCFIHSDLIHFEGEDMRPFPVERIGTDFVGGTHREPEKTTKEQKDLDIATCELLPMPWSVTDSAPLSERFRRSIRRYMEDAYCRWIWSRQNRE